MASIKRRNGITSHFRRGTTLHSWLAGTFEEQASCKAFGSI